jgi:hypothetical protein
LRLATCLSVWFQRTQERLSNFRNLQPDAVSLVVLRR